jgi:hypothetical protein
MFKAGTYLTAGGYVLRLTEDGHMLRGPLSGPGVNIHGKNTKEYGTGWVWYNDGSINLSPEWSESLRLVKEFTDPIPDAPKGYRHKDGFPQFRHAKHGEPHLYHGKLAVTSQSAIATSGGETLGEYFIFEKIEEMKQSITPGVWITKGGYLVDINSSLKGNFKGHEKNWWSDGIVVHNPPDENMGALTLVTKMPEGYKIPTPPTGYDFKGSHPRLEDLQRDCRYLNRNGIDSFICIDGCVTCDEHFGNQRIGLTKVETPKIFTGPGVYLTKGDYLVKVNDKKRGFFKNVCLCWFSDGTPNYFGSDLDIMNATLVAKMPEGYKIPECPEGFTFGDGPILREPKMGEWFISDAGKPLEMKGTWTRKLPEVGSKRIILTKVADPDPRDYPKIIPTETESVKLWSVQTPKVPDLQVSFEPNPSMVEELRKMASGGITDICWGPEIRKSDAWQIVDRYTKASMREAASKPIPFSGPGVYLTVGSRVVELNSDARLVREDGCLGDIQYYKTGRPTSEDLRLNLSQKLDIKTLGLPEGFEYRGDVKMEELKDGDWFISSVTGKPYQHSVGEVPTKAFGIKVYKKEEKMKKETVIAVASTTGNLALRALNYWLFEPAMGVGSRVLSSVRYVTFFAGITAAIAAYNFPEKTKEIVKSVLPTVNISVERPEILK